MDPLLYVRFLQKIIVVIKECVYPYILQVVRNLEH